MRIASVLKFVLLIALPFEAVAAHANDDALPPNVSRWFGPQKWVRDTEGPVISLGPRGSFDDTHLFAPCVIWEEGVIWEKGVVQEKGRYRLWYSGSRRDVDGRTFVKSKKNPVYDFGDGEHSVLTATMLRNPDGSVLREQGRLRMWFSDVSRDPWVVSHATSQDGKQWKVTDRGVVKVDQKWERTRLFYPTVLKANGVYLMWYGSYWASKKNKTALGFAVSIDGIHWHKHPANPVFRPDANRPWESHYTTSQSVLRRPDGSFRIWYASRRKPPFVNKYFAIGTATWTGLGKDVD